MKKTFYTYLVLVTLIAASACTFSQGSDVSQPLSISVSELFFPEFSSMQVLTVKSSLEWAISSMPDWVSVQGINSYSSSQFEWDITLTAQTNEGDDREGSVVFQTDRETVRVTIRQSKHQIQIIPVESITLPFSEMTLEVGSSTQLTWIITPSDATNQNLTWQSNNESCVRVSDGVITALAVGSSIITVQTEDGGKTASCSVTVVEKNVPVTGVSLDRNTLTLAQGDSQALYPIVLPENASDKTVTWSSSNPSVADVSSSGLVTADAIGNATITVTTRDGGYKAYCIVTVIEKKISVTGVSLDRTTLTMTEGDIQKLTATVIPSDATNKDLIWLSDNTSIVTVSSEGIVTAISPGTTVITVKTIDGNKTATCSVIVNAKVVSVTGVILDRSSMTMTEGDKQTLIATVNPSNATNQSVSWSSGNSSIATVNNSGVVTAVSAGTTTITVKTEDGNKTATCTVTVVAKKISVTSVRISETNLSMTEGETHSLSATVSPSDATDQSVTWTSSNSSVATVSSTGRITAVTAGTTTITVTTNDGGYKATCTVTVKAKVVSVTGVTLDRSSMTMTEGDKQTLIATVNPSNATDPTVSWSSSNASVATVGNSGVVTAISTGTATITVRTNDGGRTATCTVTVLARRIAVTGVQLNRSSLIMKEGDMQSLTATVFPSDATDRSVTWSSNNPSVATVSSTGAVTANSTGSATITVTTSDGGFRATCTVDVYTPITGLKMEPELTMTVGEAGLRVYNYPPYEKMDPNLTFRWSSTNPSVVSIWGFKYDYASLEALTPGQSDIIYMASDSFGTITLTCKVTVIEKTVSVTGVSLNKTSLTMTEGETETLIATVLPTDATNTSVTWSSSDTAVATVSSSGKITAKSAGTATITVRTVDGEKTATCSITVKKKDVDGDNEGTGEEDLF
jgi:uncharacterized protein YjdB